jgi:hypothetical protein
MKLKITEGPQLRKLETLSQFDWFDYQGSVYLITRVRDSSFTPFSVVKFEEGKQCEEESFVGDIEVYKMELSSLELFKR